MTASTFLCQQCGKPISSVTCDHCGSRLPEQQTLDLQAAHRQLARMGGHQSAATKKSEAGTNDEYYTPDAATGLIVPYLRKGAVLWEAAWGKGHMARSLRSHGFDVVGSPHLDFLTTSALDCDCIVTNPPYSKKDQFLRRAYDIGKPFAFILPADSLFGVERYKLFHQHGLQVLIPNRRIHFLNEDDSPIQFNFNTLWCCWRMLPQDVLFGDLLSTSTAS